MKTFIIALGLPLAIAGCSSTIEEPTDDVVAVVTMVFASHPTDTLEVLVADSATIAAAEAYVATQTGPRMISGRIVRGAGIDEDYPFHFLPDSVALVDIAIELCDAAPMHTADAVNAFFEASTGDANSTSATWCPWDSKPIAVERLLPD